MFLENVIDTLGIFGLRMHHQINCPSYINFHLQSQYDRLDCAGADATYSTPLFALYTKRTPLCLRVK